MNGTFWTSPNVSVQKSAFHSLQHRIAFHDFTHCCPPSSAAQRTESSVTVNFYTARYKGSRGRGEVLDQWPHTSPAKFKNYNRACHKSKKKWSLMWNVLQMRSLLIWRIFSRVDAHLFQVVSHCCESQRTQETLRCTNCNIFSYSFVHMFIYFWAFCNDAVSNRDYTALNYRMINEYDDTWKVYSTISHDII